MPSIEDGAMKPGTNDGHRDSLSEAPASIDIVSDPNELNARWARDASFWGAVVVVCLTIAQIGTVWLLPLAWAALGIAQHAIGGLAHEGLHWHAHTNRCINEVLTRLCAWPLGFSVNSWRAWHFA